MMSRCVNARSAGMLSARSLPFASPRVFTSSSSVMAISPSPITSPLMGGGASSSSKRWMARASTPVQEAAPAEEKFQYQAEVDRLMDMIVNSLYSNREVFLRELVSNASDALDKVRFTAVTSPEVMKGREELEIRVSCDKEKGTITIEDSGIGMSREQLLSNLGTIARSGTRKFMEAMKEAKGDNNLIGQFGVGFYSAFLVADRLRVQTKSHEDEKQWVWEATAGSHEFTIREDTEPSLIRGTRVTLFVKEDAAELNDPVMLSRLIKQYSQFISFPIKLFSPKKDPKKVVDEEGTTRKQEAADKKAKEEGKEAADKVEPVMKTVYEEKWDWRVENENKPIWVRSPKDVSDEMYNDFFKATFSEFLEPLAHVHFNVEGTIEFAGILYLPGMAPFDQQQAQLKSRSIKLYVKRVFISDEFDDDLMPRYLNFVKGVVDSSDLPLNVSREILQESKIVRMIRKQLVKRSLDMIDDLSNKEGGEDYKTFWEAFGRNLKIGVIEDQDNREKISKLLRFFSSYTTDQADGAMTSFEQYVSRMKSGQKSIYFMASDSLEVARSAPFVEKLIKKGLEVLYLTDPIDEAMVANLAKFGEHELVDVSKEGLQLDDSPEEAKKNEEVAKEYKVVADFLKVIRGEVGRRPGIRCTNVSLIIPHPPLDLSKKSLGDKIEKVTVSDRLTDSPCALVTSKFGWSANMERIMKSQAFGDNRTMEYMKGRKIMEINPEHDVIRGLKTLLDEKDEDRARDLSELLFETSLLTSGFQVESPRDYASKVFTLMKIALGYDIGEAPAEAAEPTKAASSSQPVEAEVVDPNDPWAGKK